MNIVHFDLKPDNLLLDRPLCLGYETPRVKVADFGLSKQKFRKYVSGVRDLRFAFTGLHHLTGGDKASLQDTPSRFVPV